MPKSFGSDAEVAAYVAKTKGAIGYVGAGVGGDGVKTIDVK
jgi:ABC-type phosphate transport system substrate-binding protein